MSKKFDFEGYSWIKVPRYVDDETLDCEERYTRLDAHHVQETKFLISKIRYLAGVLNDIADILEQGGNSEEIKKIIDQSEP